jgi:hypothetical protein
MRSTVSIVFGILLIGTFLPTSHVEAQTPLTMSPAAYQPSSPQNENLLFRAQTGHYGRFYNCDGEESKRNSPHICWKRSHDPQLPIWLGWRERIRHEASQIIQRVIDGSCCGGGGTVCPDCETNANMTPPCPECNCAQCGSQHSTGIQTTANDSEPVTNSYVAPKAIVKSKRLRRSGLVSVMPSKRQTMQAIEPPADPSTSVASAAPSPSLTSRGLLSQLRSKSPALKQPVQAGERPEFETGQRSVASMSLLERLKIARPAKTQPPTTRQATATKSKQIRR